MRIQDIAQYIKKEVCCLHTSNTSESSIMSLSILMVQTVRLESWRNMALHRWSEFWKLRDPRYV